MWLYKLEDICKDYFYSLFKKKISAASIPLLRSCAPAVAQTRSCYKCVTPEDPSMEWKDITDRAAASVFWTELFRGVCYICCGKLSFKYPYSFQWMFKKLEDKMFPVFQVLLSPWVISLRNQQPSIIPLKRGLSAQGKLQWFLSLHLNISSCTSHQCMVP